MESKNKKWLIVLVVILLIFVVVLGTYMYCDKKLNLFSKDDEVEEKEKDNQENPNNNDENNLDTDNTNTDNYLVDNEIGDWNNFLDDDTYRQTLQIENNSCLKPDLADPRRYSNYFVTITNINGNSVYREIKNYNKGVKKDYFNDSIIFDGKPSELLITDVCNCYGYLLVTSGWEGPGNVEIINSKGDTVYGYRGNVSSCANNGVIDIRTVERKDINNSDIRIYKEYSLDLKNDVIQEDIKKEYEFSCNEFLSGVDVNEFGMVSGKLSEEDNYKFYRCNMG